MIHVKEVGPGARRRSAGRLRAVALGAVCASLVLALLLPDPTHAQSRSGTETEPVVIPSRVLAIAAKKPKKMPQGKREKIKQGKIKKAQEYESVSGGTESLVSTTDFDESGNTRSRHHRPQPGSTMDETLEVDLVRDVVTKSSARSTVEVDAGGVPQTVEDLSETNFEYEEVDFEDGKDHLLKKLEMKKNGVSVAHMDHAYDGSGRLHRMTQNQADGPGMPISKLSMTEFTYDSQDRPVMIVTFDHRAHDLNPTEDRVISRQKREYGANGQVSRIENLAPDLRDLPPGSDSLLSYTEFTYDASLNLLTRKTWQRLVGPSGTEDVLVSDDRHDYDSAGNELETTIVLPTPPGSQGTDLPPSGYRATTSRKTTRTFDNFGNVLTELTIETDPDGLELSRRNRRIVYDKFD